MYNMFSFPTKLHLISLSLHHIDCKKKSCKHKQCKPILFILSWLYKFLNSRWFRSKVKRIPMQWFKRIPRAQASNIFKLLRKIDHKTVNIMLPLNAIYLHNNPKCVHVNQVTHIHVNFRTSFIKETARCGLIA